MRDRGRGGLAGEPVAAKVPEVTVLFWIIKVLTTGMGEAAADYLANVDIFLAGLVGLAGFVVALRWQFRVRCYVAGVYWFAVAMVAVFGTMVADGIHVVLGVPYAASTALCALALVFVFRSWYRSEETLSIHSIMTRRRERYYWSTVLVTFALGTALGDLTATTLHLGFLGSAVLFAAVIAVPALGWWRFGINEVAAFWGAYVITRPLGASVADWLGKAHSMAGGLGYGDGPVADVSAAVIVLLVGYVALRRNDIQRPVATTTGDGVVPRLLYHFTSHEALPGILQTGSLAPSPVHRDDARSQRRTRFTRLPDVVWLSDDASPGHGMDHGLARQAPDEPDRRAVRITVAIRGATHWPVWSRIHSLPRRLRRRIDEQGGGLGARWWIATTPVTEADWIDIVELPNERRLWPPRGHLNDLEPTSD